MPTKYDTNPLDPDFPEKARAAAEAQSATQTFGYSGAPTQQFPQTLPTEEQTRRFGTHGAPYSQPYGSPYNGQNVPAAYQNPALIDPGHARKRKVDKVGLPENIMVTLPYLPFSIGLVAGIVELLIVPRHETKVRFHAAQGLAAHIGILLVTTILGVVGNFANVARFGSFAFGLVTTILLVVFAIKAWKGRPVHIEAIDDLTNWLDEKIKIK